MKKIRVGTLIISLLLPLMTGMISAALTTKGMALYGNMKKPPLSPPAWVFPVAWTILYLMMGVSLYFLLVSEADNCEKNRTLLLFGIQLIMNFCWSIIFFNGNMFLLAFIWLLIMWGIVIFCAIGAYRINRIAAYLLVPYILWLTFAGYLNLGAYILKSRK